MATLAFLYVAFVGYSAKHWPAVAVPGFLIGLFNPVVPVHLPKEWWALIDVTTAGYLLALASHVESKFAQIGSIRINFGELLVSLAMAAFAGAFAATALAFLFFLVSYPLDWLGKPSPFKSLRYLFMPVFAGAVVFHVVGLAYHEASSSSSKDAA